jgi:hypothetical protein
MDRGFIGALSLSVTFSLLGGCGVSQPPIGGPAPNRAIAQRSVPSASSDDLLYAVSHLGRGSAILMLTYPDGKRVGALRRDIGLYLCSDESNGNVFFPSNTRIFEYAHGGTKPIATLSAPSSDYDFEGCAVDPTTGNLAVTTVNLSAVLVYPAGQDTPALYYGSKGSSFTYCGYDSEGNLFVDGSLNGALLLDELPKGGSSLEQITLSLPDTIPGPVQWDGTEVTIENPEPPIIYRIQVSGSVGTVVGTTKLRNQTKTKRVPYSRTWIEGDTVITSTGRGNKRIGLWRYPAGGKPLRVLKNIVNGQKSGFWAFTISHGG